MKWVRSVWPGEDVVVRFDASRRSVQTIPNPLPSAEMTRGGRMQDGQRGHFALCVSLEGDVAGSCGGAGRVVGALVRAVASRVAFPHAVTRGHSWSTT